MIFPQSALNYSPYTLSMLLWLARMHLYHVDLNIIGCLLVYLLGRVVVSVAYLVFRGPLGHDPFSKNLFFTIGKSRKTWFGPLCVVHTSGQQKFGPLYNIPNTPLRGILPNQMGIRLPRIIMAEVKLQMKNFFVT